MIDLFMFKVYSWAISYHVFRGGGLSIWDAFFNAFQGQRNGKTNEMIRDFQEKTWIEAKRISREDSR